MDSDTDYKFSFGQVFCAGVRNLSDIMKAAKYLFILV